ncbi:MAG TPA: PilZ domain-containing protein [Anaeromyxobacter sp.]|nr:PilZ domain-containing protein [Anaeromyxobacter sp.]
MSVSDWLRVFRAMHERAKQGGLSREDMDAYLAGCDELARALMAAQKLAPRPGEAPRHALRVARAVQVDLETPVSKVRSTTVDLGVTGFSTILAKAPPGGEELTATMKLPGREPLVTAVLPAEARPQTGSVRVAFTFRKLPDADRAALEALVIDTALSQLAA